MKDNIKIPMAFSALDPYLEDNIIKATEKEIRGQKFIEYGDYNKYPSYIWDLYSNVSTLQSIINGTKDYIKGNKITSNNELLSDRKATDLVDAIALDLLIYGGTYISILRNKLGNIALIDPVDFRNMRSDKKNELFFYSEDFNNKSYGRCKYNIYPKFDKDAKDVTSSIYFYKNMRHQTYPTPMWSSAVIAAEIERNINQYHLNNLYNGFAPNTIVSFNNGVPTDEIRDEIERQFNEKYSGYQNAGRIILNWATDKDHGVTIEKVESDDYGDRYKTLQERSKSELFVAFRATPNLFGLPTETTGFNSQEYADAFKLYNKTVIQPLQETICNIMDDITGMSGSISIEPFTIDFENNTVQKNEVE